MPYIGRGPGFGIRQKYFFTATAGQTSISGSDDNGLSLAFTDGLFVDVYLNGVLLDPNTDYNTTTANTVAGLSALSLNDFVEIVAYDSFTVGDVVPASTGGTFSGAVTVNNNITSLATVTGVTGTFSGNVTGVAGTFSGDVSGLTLNATGDTSAGDNAAIGFTATEGLILTGQGSTSDVTVKNDADAEVFSIATGSTVVDFVSTPTVDGSAIGVGKQTIWIPAGAMYPSTTNPCSALTQVETTALRPDLKVLDFDKDSDEFAQFSIAFPKSWNEGTITFQPFWTMTGTDTGDVVWQLAAIAASDNDSINTAFGGTVATSAKAHSGTSNDLNVSAESGAMTISGTPAEGDVCFFQINRDVSADDLNGDARLVGIKLHFTTNASNDG